MPNQEQHNLSGCLTITLHDGNGCIRATRCVHNLITTAGKNLVAQMFTGEIQEKPGLMIAIGSGQNAANVSDTTLQKPEEEVTATTQVPTTVERDGEQKVVATVKATLDELPEGMEQHITEAGIVFKLSRSDVLYNHVTFPPVTRSANLQMTLSWEVTF